MPAPTLELPARALLCSALHGNREAIEAAAGLPAGAWPDGGLRAIGRALASLRARGAPVDVSGVYAEGQALGLGNGSLAAAISELSGFAAPSCDPDRDAKALREAHARAMFVEKARTLATVAPEMPLDEARHFICDLDLLESIPDPENILPLADVVNAPDPEPPLFSSGVYRGKLNLLIAESNTGKSFLALQAALSLATGRGTLEAFKPEARGRALVLSGEDDPAVIRARLEAITTAHCTSWRDALDTGALSFVTAVSPLIEFDAEGKATLKAAWRELERRAKGYDLVIVDPLVSWFRLASENDNAAIGTLSQHLIGLAESADCAVLLLHHSSKAGSRALDQVSSRGGSALACAARWIANLRGLSDDDAEKAEIAPGDAWRYVELATSKNSYAARIGAPVTLRREHGGALVDCDLRRERSGRIAEALAAALAESEAHLTRRDICRGYGNLAKQIREEVRAVCGEIQGRDLERAIAYGIEFGLISEVEIPGKGTPRREVLPSDTV